MMGYSGFVDLICILPLLLRRIFRDDIPLGGLLFFDCPPTSFAYDNKWPLWIMILISFWADENLSCDDHKFYGMHTMHSRIFPSRHGFLLDAPRWGVIWDDSLLSKYLHFWNSVAYTRYICQMVAEMVLLLSDL